MSRLREEVSLAFSTESNSIFIYYLTGTLALTFLITLFITRSLQRKQPVVTELVHDSNISEDLVTFLVIIETSIWPGSGCPYGVKVYMQLVGMNSVSQYFLLQSTGSGKAILKRGFTDIFMIKLPVSLGPISNVKFILSGLDGPLKWRIRRVELHHPSSNRTVQMPASIIVTERCEAKTHHEVYMVGSERSVSERLLLYHQWLAQYGNTVRYGAFTAITHVLCVFTSLTALLDFTLIAYILLPTGKYEGEFELVPQSLLIGCICPAFGYCCILFLIELLLRNIKSQVKSPGNAYYTVCNENRNLNTQHRKSDDSLQYPFMLQENDFDSPFLWDLNFNVKTVFLSKFLRHMNSEIGEIFFGGQDLDTDKFLSINDVKDISVFTIQIPKYSGIALNHLLSDETQGKRTRSSLFDLINRDQSVLSLGTVMTAPSHLSVTDDSASSAIVVDLVSDHFDYDNFHSDKNPSQISSLCRVDGDMFWRQYKHHKQVNKNRRTTDVSNAGAIDYENSGERDERAEDFPEKTPAGVDSESDSSGREQITDTAETANTLVRKRKHSVKKDSDVDKDEKTEKPAELLDIFIDLTNVEETKEVHLEIADIDGSEDETHCKGRDINREDPLRTHKLGEDVIESLSTDWELLLKSRSRKLVADICTFFRQVRVQVIEGEVIHILPAIVEWFDEVLCSIAIACTVKSSIDYEVAALDPDVMNIAVYMAGEIIMLTINNVYKSLKTGRIDLPDIVVQSHQVMLAVEETAFSMLYAMNSELVDRDQLKTVRCLDAQKYLCYICAEFLKNSFQLIVHANELTWAFFEIYLLQTLKYSIDRHIVRDVLLYVEENLKSESKETVILQKLCKTATEEAKCEVWDEYNIEKNIFIDIAVKQEILSKITMTRNTILQRKQVFDEEYELLAKPPKSRLQILAEKRKQNKDENRKNSKKNRRIKTKMTAWEKETGRKDIPRYKELVEHSMLLEKNVSTLKFVQEQLNKRWSRLGMKADTQGMMCLVQSLIYQHTETGTSEIEDYLQVKRVESKISEFLQMMLDDLIHYILTSTIDEYSLMAFPDQLQIKLSVEDICIRADTLTDLLVQELDTITDYAIDIERHKMEMDRNLVESTALLIMKKSSQMLHWTQSVTDQYSTVLAKKSLAMLSEQKDSRKPVIKERTDENFEEKSDLDLVKPDASVTMETEVGDAEISIKDLRIELKLIQTFLENFTKIEKLRSSTTLLGYLERQKQERSRIANVILHNIIDSYYIIEEGDDSHTFTEDGLYQIEYDVTRESRKKYSPFVKKLATICLFIVIVLSFVVVTLIGSQFDTTQNQEYLCYYLVSVFIFAVVFEPIRALAIADFCEK